MVGQQRRQGRAARTTTHATGQRRVDPRPGVPRGLRNGAGLPRRPGPGSPAVGVDPVEDLRNAQARQGLLVAPPGARPATAARKSRRESRDCPCAGHGRPDSRFPWGLQDGARRQKKATKGTEGTKGRDDRLEGRGDEPRGSREGRRGRGSGEQGLDREALGLEALEQLDLVGLVAAGDQHQPLLGITRDGAARPRLQGCGGGGLPRGT